MTSLRAGEDVCSRLGDTDFENRDMKFEFVPRANVKNRKKKTQNTKRG